MSALPRPRNHTIAAVLQFIASAAAVAWGARDLMPGATPVEEMPPYFVVLAAFAIGVVGLVSAYGIWQGQRWGVILTIVTRASDGILAAPGILFAPTPTLKVMASTGVVLAIVIIGLLLWPKPRPATA